MSTKIVDLDYEDSMFNLANNIPSEIAKLNFPQKYLKLVAADGSVYDLEVAEVTRDEFYLMIK